MRALGRKALPALLGSCAVLAIAAPNANASLTWSSLSHDFGAANVGTPAAAKTLTLTASCDSELIAGVCGSPAGGIHFFGAPVVTGPGFALAVPNTCLPGVLVTASFPSSTPCVTTVTFTPAAAGAASGSLTLPTGPDVALSGTGVAPSPDGTGTGGKGKKCKKKKKRSASAAKKKCKKKRK